MDENEVSPAILSENELDGEVDFEPRKSRAEIKAIEKGDIEARVEKKASKINRRTIYKVRGEACDGEEPKNAWESLVFFLQWASMFVGLPVFVAFILVLIPVCNIYEPDPAVRDASIAYGWISHSWIIIAIYSPLHWYLADFYILDPVFQRKLEWQHKIAITTMSVILATIGITTLSFWQNPVPFAWFVVVNLSSMGQFMGCGYVIFFDYLKGASEAVTEMVIERIKIFLWVYVTVHISIFVYVSYYLGYQGLIKRDVGTVYMSIYTLLLAVVKEIMLKCFEILYDMLDKSGHPLGQFWTLCFHSYFLTIILSDDKTAFVQMLLIFLVDMTHVIRTIIKICLSFRQVNASVAQKEADAENGITEEMRRNSERESRKSIRKSITHPKESVKSFTTNLAKKSKIVASTLANLNHKADLGKGRRLTNELLEDGQLIICSSAAILAEFTEFFIPVTYFCIMTAISFLPNFKYILSVTSDEYGYAKVEDMNRMWMNMGIVIGMEFFSFTFIVGVCHFFYDIHLLPVLFDFWENHGTMSLQVSLGTFFVIFGVVYEPWGNDLTFNFDWVECQNINYNSTTCMEHLAHRGDDAGYLNF